VKAASETSETDRSLTQFAAARWSAIRNGGLASSENEDLARLCQIYWRPVFTFIYRRGYSAADAQDLTQDFFIMIMEGKFFQSAGAEKSRFRSLLLKALQNFLIDAAVKRRRSERNGQVQFVSWERWMAESPAQASISPAEMDASPPEALFDAGWAAAIAEEALRRLRLECESEGRQQAYAVLHPCLASDSSEIAYEKLSSALGVPETSVKSMLHHFRTRYRALLREEVSKTVETEANVDDEIRYLCATLSAEPN
jgi:DNA-directed RNA polymerase specialized sigma24 family protein